MGTRLMFTGRFMRFTSRASMDGLLMPVIETKNSAPRSSVENPDRDNAQHSAFWPRS